jgi:hypothetical protein
VRKERRRTERRLVMRERRVCDEEEGGMVVAAAAGGSATKRWPFPRAKPTKPIIYLFIFHFGPWGWPGHIKRPQKNILLHYFLFYFIFKTLNNKILIFLKWDIWQLDGPKISPKAIPAFNWRPCWTGEDPFPIYAALLVYINYGRS